MPANHRSSKHRTRPGAGRTTPKGTRPPGVDARPADDRSTTVDHHLDTSRSANAHGRSMPPPTLRTRTGTRGGR